MDQSNEELVLRIKDGEEDLIPSLWDRILPSLRYYSSEYYRNHKARCDQVGIEEEDLMQESYFALLKALSTYEANRDYTFITHLRYPCRNHFAKCIKLRAARRTPDALNSTTISIDATVSADNDLMYAEVIPDPHAEEAFTEMERTQLRHEVQHEVSCAVARLPERENTITVMHAFQGFSFTECSKVLNIKESTLRAQFSDARRKLRSMPNMRRIWFDYYGAGLKGTGLNAFRNRGFTSSVELTVIKMLDLL